MGGYMKRILIGATSSGCGKTTITSGIIKALSDRGMKIQPYKVGPDYIDTSYHKLAAGITSRNLDNFILDTQEIKKIFSKNSKDVDISVVEGVMGFYDGYQADSDYCSTASMAKILDCPAILIIDGKGMASSAAAIVKGFKEFDKDVRLEGVIINNIGSDSHYNILKEAIEKNVEIKVLGRIPNVSEISLPSRHLGLVLGTEIEDAKEKVEKMAELVNKHIDIEKLLEIASDVSKLPEISTEKKHKTNVKLGLALDKAFNFYYEDSLDILRDLGVEIINFSPLTDSSIPDCHGLYFGGGYPEIFASELSSNTSMRESIKKAYQANMPIYGECGGLMYLGESLVDLEGNEYKMAALLKGKSKMTKGLKRFGYSKGVLLEDTIIGTKGQEVKGHEFHHSTFETDLKPVYEMQKVRYDNKVDRWAGGYKSKNTFASYLHTHFCSDYNLAYKFCEKMEEYRDINI